MEKFGLINQSLVPVRRQPGDIFEMTNQLIFGDLLIIKSEVNNWLLIESNHDKYEGWVDIKQVKQLNAREYKSLTNSNMSMVGAIAGLARNEQTNSETLLPLGSRLYHYKDNIFNNFEGNISFSGTTITPPKSFSKEQIIHTALKFLSAPYLWGGRSPWGIDCSGLVQICFLLNGMELPRDAADQAQYGELIDFIHEALPGDLAFFDNKEEKIIHVGIVMPNYQIIHAHGQVRVDTLDHQGIYQENAKKYTHKLRLIKRLI